MRVIEELVHYLYQRRGISKGEVAWLREQGYLGEMPGLVPDLSCWEDIFLEARESESMNRESMQQTALDELEEQQIQQGLRRKAQLPSRSSKGTRKRRAESRQRRGRSADGNNANDQQPRRVMIKTLLSCLADQSWKRPVTIIQMLGDIGGASVQACLELLEQLKLAKMLDRAEAIPIVSAAVSVGENKKRGFLEDIKKQVRQQGKMSTSVNLLLSKVAKPK